MAQNAGMSLRPDWQYVTCQLLPATLEFKVIVSIPTVIRSTYIPRANRDLLVNNVMLCSAKNIAMLLGTLTSAL